MENFNLQNELYFPDDFNLADDFDCDQLDEMITNRSSTVHALSTNLPIHNEPSTSNAFALPEQYYCATSSANSSLTTSSASTSSLNSNPNMSTTKQVGATNRESYREPANFYASDASNSSSAFVCNNVSSGKSSRSRKSQSRHPLAKRQRVTGEHDEGILDDNSDSDSIITTTDDQSLIYACNNGPKRRAKLFKIIICLRKYDIEITRDHFFNCFKTLTRSTVIVAREQNESMYQERTTKYRASHIFKIFIDLGTNQAALTSVEMHKHVSTFIQQAVNQTEQQFSLIDMVDENITDEDRVSEISFSSVRNRKSAIGWVSASDVDLRFTPDCMNWDDFSESYRLQMWLRQNVNKKFDPFDALVLKLKKPDAMQKMLTLFQRKNHIRYKLKRVQTDVLFGDWRDELINWFNDWIDNGWRPKKQQVLITGPPNAGKTSFIENVLLKGVPSEAILTPEKSSSKYQISNFAWSKSDEVYNSVVYADEFQIEGYDQGKLKVILQGAKFMPQKKFVNMKTVDEIQLKMPMIFVGNYHFPQTAIDLGIPERFLQIKIPEDLPVYTPTAQEPYKVEVFDNHIHVYNAIPSTSITTSSTLKINDTSVTSQLTSATNSPTSLATSATSTTTSTTSPITSNETSATDLTTSSTTGMTSQVTSNDTTTSPICLVASATSQATSTSSSLNVSSTNATTPTSSQSTNATTPLTNQDPSATSQSTSATSSTTGMSSQVISNDTTTSPICLVASATSQATSTSSSLNVSSTSATTPTTSQSTNATTPLTIQDPSATNQSTSATSSPTSQSTNETTPLTNQSQSATNSPTSLATSATSTATSTTSPLTSNVTSPCQYEQPVETPHETTIFMNKI